MREILFRGKRIDNGEWVGGDHFEVGSFRDKHHYLMQGYANIKLHYYDGRSRVEMNCHEVDEETIGQDTGLTDKNGKEIFEGDVVRGFYKPTGEKVIGKVEYANHLARWLIHGYGEYAGLSHCSDIEIIGNIHDNPELLEVNND